MRAYLGGQVAQAAELGVTLTVSETSWVPQRLNAPVERLGPGPSFDIGHQPEADLAVYRKLARTIGISTKPIACKIDAKVLGVRYGTLHVARIPC